MIYIKKEISPKNKRKRVIYREIHKDKIINNWQSWIIFTDKFHIDLATIGTAYILQEERIRIDSENIQERPVVKSNKIYIAGQVLQNKKYNKLIFYYNKYKQDKYKE